MPYLDVSEVLVDPELCDRVRVLRYAETISERGRVTSTPEVIEPVIGVMNSAGPNDLMRLPEDQKMGRVMSFITKFRLRGPSPGYQPDHIVWQGTTYIVLSIDPYAQYGAGFVQAIIGSTDIIDPPTPEEDEDE